MSTKTYPPFEWNTRKLTPFFLKKKTVWRWLAATWTVQTSTCASLHRVQPVNINISDIIYSLAGWFPFPPFTCRSAGQVETHLPPKNKNRSPFFKKEEQKNMQVSIVHLVTKECYKSKTWASLSITYFLGSTHTHGLQECCPPNSLLLRHVSRQRLFGRIKRNGLSI